MMGRPLSNADTDTPIARIIRNGLRANDITLTQMEIDLGAPPGSLAMGSGTLVLSRAIEIGEYLGIPPLQMYAAFLATRGRHCSNMRLRTSDCRTLPDEYFLASLEHSLKKSSFPRRIAHNDAENTRLLAIGGSEITAVWPCANVRYRNERKSA